MLKNGVKDGLKSSEMSLQILFHPAEKEIPHLERRPWALWRCPRGLLIPRARFSNGIPGCFTSRFVVGVGRLQRLNLVLYQSSVLPRLDRRPDATSGPNTPI